MDSVQVGDTVIGVVGSVALQMGEAALIVQYPALGLPVIKQVWETLVGQLAAEVMKNLEQSANVFMIVVKEDQNASDAKTSADALNKAISDPTTSPADLSKARDDFKAKYAALIRMRNSTPLS